jgi:hypothetical protein
VPVAPRTAATIDDMLNVDLTRAARSQSERIAVIDAVANAGPHEPETDSIEWKSNLDVSTTEGAFKVARGILGFGNRDPGYSLRFARGCAYFLVGVEAGSLVGAQAHDSADVDQWLGRFIARGEPQWSVDYLDVGGKNSDVRDGRVAAVGRRDLHPAACLRQGQGWRHLRAAERQD